MGEVLIPDDVRAFLLQHIDAIAQLEALLLLRADPTCVWSAETPAKRLYISTQEATAVLERLATDSFLTTPPDVPGSYQYHPASGDWPPLWTKTAPRSCRENPHDKLRSPPLAGSLAA